jgi:hypothetical protein
MRRGSQDVILLSMLLEVLRSVLPGLMTKPVERKNSRNIKCNSVNFTFAYHEGIQTRLNKEIRVLYLCCSSMDSC